MGTFRGCGLQSQRSFPPSPLRRGEKGRARGEGQRAEALEKCEALPLAGHSQDRLPNNSFLTQGMVGRGQGGQCWGAKLAPGMGSQTSRVKGCVPPATGCQGVCHPHSLWGHAIAEGAGLENPFDPVLALWLLRCKP